MKVSSSPVFIRKYLCLEKGSHAIFTHRKDLQSMAFTLLGGFIFSSKFVGVVGHQFDKSFLTKV